jgi:hypothetical protein
MKGDCHVHRLQGDKSERLHRRCSEFAKANAKEKRRSISHFIPACGNDNERFIVLTPARGLFYCFDAKVGGDCLALVQHITDLRCRKRHTS